VSGRRLVLSILPGFYAVCRLDAADGVPGWAGGSVPEGGAVAGSAAPAGLASITRTAEELSIVCPEAAVPGDVRSERGWRCLKVQGPIEFTAIGIVASLVAPLAREGVSVFVVSTFDTDYLMVKAADLEKTVFALSGDGHQVLLEG
jgi:uncharacterized protein